MIVTIDGPTGSGKSSLARALAQKLDIYYLNTGMLYRAVAYMLLHKHGTIWASKVLKDISWLKQEDLACIDRINYSYDQTGPHVIIDDKEVTSRLYDPVLDQLSSIVGSWNLMRDGLLQLQRNIADSHDIVVDGRDCGSVVFPYAQVKIFLIAHVDVRAARIYHDQSRSAHKLDLQYIKDELLERDSRDMERAIAPLIIPQGAIVLDNSNMTFDETVERCLQIISKIIG